MKTDTGRPSSTRSWWYLALGAVVFIVGFSTIESLVRREPGASDSGSTSAVAGDAASYPLVRLVEGGGVEIRHDFFRRTTVRLQDRSEEQVLHDCLQPAFERVRADAAEGRDGERVRRETQRILADCMQFETDHPLPRPPES